MQGLLRANHHQIMFNSSNSFTFLFVFIYSAWYLVFFFATANHPALCHLKLWSYILYFASYLFIFFNLQTVFTFFELSHTYIFFVHNITSFGIYNTDLI